MRPREFFKPSMAAIPAPYLESIYNLLPKDVYVPPKEARHISKYPGSIQPSYSTFGIAATSQPALINGGGHWQPFTTRKVYKKPHATFGRPSGSVRPNPKKFLKRGYHRSLSQSVRFSTKKSFKVAKSTRFPKVPLASERPIHGLRSNKNYIISNAVDNILRAPRMQRKKVRYTNKEDYGKVPAYLTEINQQMEAEYQTIKAMANQKEEDLKKKRYVLSEGEKKKLAADLKQKWDEIHRRYQKQTHITDLDCYGKVHRKLDMEKQMDLISSQIEKLKQPIIFVDATK